MRIPFTGLEIRSQAAMATEIEHLAKFLAEEQAADLAKRYAYNVDCLRAAVAANLGLSSPHHVRPDSMLIGPMTRAIEAFADVMAKERDNVHSQHGEVRAA